MRKTRPFPSCRGNFLVGFVFFCQLSVSANAKTRFPVVKVPLKNEENSFPQLTSVYQRAAQSQTTSSGAEFALIKLFEF